MGFDGKTCALVAACDFNAGHFREQWERGAYRYILAVDGGFARLREIGCVPHYVLGDFDSLGYVPQGDNVEVHPAHKDESDLELALEHVFAHGCEEVAVYGALGGRLDHTMAALQTCARFAEAGLGVTLYGMDVAVRVLAGPARFELPPLERGIVSVFSATDEAAGVSEWGMEYPLSDARLTNRTTLGLSNELRGEPAGVSVERGTLYVFHPLGK